LTCWHRDHAQIDEVRAQVTPFTVDVRKADAFSDLFGQPSRIEPDPAVTAFVRAVEITLQASRPSDFDRHVSRLRFHLLHAYDVGALACKPGEQSLLCRGTDSVEIEGDNA
jgi:hypothetical protein